MKDVKKELAEACGKVMDAELASAVKNAKRKPHTFSPEFGSRLAELLKTDISLKSCRPAKGVRILLTAAAALLVLTTAACAVPKIRESIAGFFVQVFGDHDEYSDPAVTKERIEEEYGLVPVPDGFRITSEEKTDTSRTVIYSNDELGGIMLHQGASGHNAGYVDNEHGTLIEKDIGGKTVRMHLDELFAQASWVQDGYYFSLSYSSPIEQAVFEEWIASVDKLRE